MVTDNTGTVLTPRLSNVDQYDFQKQGTESMETVCTLIMTSPTVGHMEVRSGSRIIGINRLQP